MNVLMLVLGSNASAWDLVTVAPYVWTEFPVVQVPPTEEVAGVAPGVTAATVAASQAMWTEAGCTGPLAMSLAPAAPSTVTFNLGVGDNTITVGDPDGDLEPGVVADTLVQRFGIAFQLGDEALQVANNGDIAFNNDVAFTTASAIAAGGCSDAWDVKAVLDRELGEFLGLGASLVPGSVMTIDHPVACEPARAALSDDDAAGIAALYGLGYRVSCDPLVGAAPLATTCRVASVFDAAASPDVTWRIDGGAAIDADVLDHTFTEPGAYDVEACAPAGGCGQTWCEFVSIAVCGPIEARPKAEPTLDPQVVRLLNDTPIDAAGCLTDVLWTVTDEAGEVLLTDARWEPVVQLEPGAYEARLEITGVSGEASEVVSFTVKAPAARDALGCSHAGAPPWLGAMALAGLGAAVPRRQRGASGTPSRR